MTVTATIAASAIADSRPSREPAPARPPAGRRSLTVLQLGLGWFPEQPGGLDRYYYELLRALPNQGVNFRGLVVGSEAVAASTGGRVRAVAPKSATIFRRLRAVRSAVNETVRSGDVELLVSHFALYAAGALGAMGRLPNVVHFHGPWAAESRAEGGGRMACQGKAVLERAVYQRASRLICLSEAFAEILRRDYRIAPDRIRVVPGGVDVSRFDIAGSRPAARERLGWPAGRPIVLCVRRLVQRMGLTNLVEAAAAVRRQVPDALVLIAGRGPMSDRLRQQIAQLGLNDMVKLLGYVPDAELPLAYRAADLTIVPSTALEGFGLVAAESLAAGTPALVTPVGGLPEVVHGLAPQWVLEGSAPAQLGERMVAMLAGRLGAVAPEACAAYVRRHFDWSIIAARVREVYAEVLGVAPCQTVNATC
ncbi:MAG TPA: glycosyltransferase family 4 protein [Tepidisphaeraceae bacterium]|jgi:glycosyltransferase involved in cell wall biosynthesis